MGKCPIRKCYGEGGMGFWEFFFSLGLDSCGFGCLHSSSIAVKVFSHSL
jgi:hypothetical protein